MRTVLIDRKTRQPIQIADKIKHLNGAECVYEGVLWSGRPESPGSIFFQGREVRLPNLLLIR
jgi:hypothetical protein